MREGSLLHLIDRDFHEEIITANTIIPYPVDRLEDLRLAAIHWANHNAKLYDDVVLDEARFTLKFTDAPGFVWDVRRSEKQFRVTRCDDVPPDTRVIITTKASMLEHALSRIWGGDAMAAGYALIVEMFDEDALEKNLDIVCVRLITRYPIMREDILKQPLRAAKYFATNPTIAALHLKQKIVLKPYVNRYPYNERDHWISYSKCDLCKVCAIPEIVYEDDPAISA